MLKARYWPLVKEGKKTITIRRNTKLQPGDLVEIHAGGKIRGVAKILHIYEKKLDEIGEEEAKKEGMAVDRLKRELERIYGKNATLKIIEFELLKIYDPPKDPERRRYGDYSPQEIARRAIEEGIAREEDKEILLAVAKTGSIRAVAQSMGGLKHRRRIRKILERYARLLGITS